MRDSRILSIQDNHPTIEDKITAMVKDGGTPGSIIACNKLVEAGSQIGLETPSSIVSGSRFILEALDFLEIHDEEIGVFFYEVCDCSPAKSIALLYANYQGRHYAERKLIRAAIDQAMKPGKNQATLDFSAMIEKAESDLRGFDTKKLDEVMVESDQNENSWWEKTLEKITTIFS